MNARIVLLAVLAALSSCASYSFQLHGAETDKSHYVIIRSRPGATDLIYDCYSRPAPEAGWGPTCREVRLQDLDEWSRR